MTATAVFQKRALVENASGSAGSITDISESTHAYIWKYHRTQYLTAIIGSIVVCIGLLVSLPAFASDAIDFAFVIFIWPLTLYINYSMRIRSAFMQQIARVIGFSYAAKGDPDTVDSRILHGPNTSERSMADLLVGTYHQHPLRIYSYTATTNLRAGPISIQYTVFELTVDGHLPDIILGKPDSPATVQGYAPITLEGDFNKYFALYAPKGYDVDIRVIFTPDIMAMLIDKYRTYRIEIVNNKMYIFSPPFASKEGFFATHDLLDALFEKLLPALREAGSEPGGVGSMTVGTA